MGDFCVLYNPTGTLTDESARVLIENDRPFAEANVVNERTFARCQ